MLDKKISLVIYIVLKTCFFAFFRESLKLELTEKAKQSLHSNRDFINVENFRFISSRRIYLLFRERFKVVFAKTF